MRRPGHRLPGRYSIMPNKMLIDASHPEETRVVVTRGNRIEEFDFESQDKKQLRGNIYLARVTRVEPSLQAAFIEYGGNRHGFLAFSEIHPDYYQIPMADRQALLRADQEAAEAEEEEDEEERSGKGRRRRGRSGKNRHRDDERKASTGEQAEGGQPEAEHASDDNLADIEPIEAAPFLSNSFGAAAAQSDDDASEPTPSEQGHEPSSADDAGDADDKDGGSNPSGSSSMPAAIEGESVSEPVEGVTDEARAAPEGEEEHDDNGNGNGHDDDEHDEVESVGADDAIEEAQPRRRANRRQYKIQEVIKRRQILLVQVVKEERGNKGAALTTYLSLAGRYSVLMPNTARGGGISRKITNAQDRKRLKDVVKDLEVPQGMGVILRTAGESRTKAEIKRDYEYLMRMWENVRTLTLQSTAPALVYEEGSLIKRSVRDLYNKDIDEILVAGENGYREAKDFMRMLMPSHAKVVQPYRETVPMFARNGIEAQLDRMLQPQVNLKSGGYIIINQTEALVAIDVNSGRSTKEHSIEDTALQTNLEAADEVARQLRLRDLAGLIVVDFIDMEENRNNRAVEKRMKDALKNDRARIQVGRISHFGLLEMSRQRIRASVLESTTQACPHCGGTGHVRSDSSVALHVIRAIEEYLLKDTRYNITVRTPVATALYVLNHKRSTLVEMEMRFGLTISLEADETLGNQHYAISRGTAVETPVTIVAPPPMPVEEEADDVPMEAFDDEVEMEAEEVSARSEPRDQQRSESNGNGDRDHDRKRKRRRRRRGGRDKDREPGSASEAHSDDESIASNADEAETGDDAAQYEVDATVKADDGEQKKRRRGKRGGRRNRRGDEDTATSEDDAEAAIASTDSVEAAPVAASDVAPVESAIAETPLGDAPEANEPVAEVPAAPVKKPRARRTKKADAAEAAETVAAEPAVASEPVPTAEPVPVAPIAEPAPTVVQTEPAESAEEPARPARRRTSSTSETTEPVVTSTGSDADNSNAPPAPRRGGWWQRKT